MHLVRHTFLEAQGRAELMTNSLVVVGIGQALRGDDGAGLAAVKAWQQSYPESTRRSNVRVEMAELPGTGLLALLEGAQAAILVDAVRSGATPGMVHSLSEADLAYPIASSASAHGWGVAETLALGRQLIPEQMPESIQVIGIEAGDVGMGEGLSSAVSAALTQVADQIEEAVCRAIG